jgi:hypothetical protein
VAFGRYKKFIEKETSKNILLVVNCYRPLSRTAAEIIKYKNEIEACSGFEFTGLVNNSNIGVETTWNDLESSYNILNEVSKISGLPIELITGKQEFSLYANDANFLGLKLESVLFKVTP